MFRSEKLARITIQVPEPFISATTGVLTRFKLLHLIRIDETPLGRLGYGAETDGSLLAEFENLLHEADALAEALHAPLDGAVLRDEVIPEKEVFKVRERLGEIRGEVEATLDDLESTAEILREKKIRLEKFTLLPGDLDFSRLSGRRFVNWKIGLTPTQGIEKLEESLSEVHHALIELGPAAQERSVVFVFGLLKDATIFERALKGAFFEAIEIRPDVSGKVEDVVAALQSEIAGIDTKIAALSGQRDIFRGKFGEELQLLREKIITARRMLSARRYFGKIDKRFLITGWIPERLFGQLAEEIGRVAEGQALFEKVDPEDLREVREGVVKIPILFNNPLLISPFEKLTGLYGTPSYKEVEPTVFFALTFLLLFGMMFGDAGQGAVLFLLGYYIFRRLYKYMDYGIILMECGVSATLFGFLYGTVFGMETLLPALWFRPMESISYFVKVTLSLGIAMVSLGLILNLINAIRLKEYEKLLSASGFAGAVLYWIAAGLAMKRLLTGAVAPGELRIFGWTAAVLMIVIVLHRPLYRLIVKRERPARVIQPGLAGELMESVVELFDDLIRFIANTVSFIRVAAFALSHAALFIAVFSIANVVSHQQGGGASYWLTVAIGNVVIILLEGLVVSIQTVRLEYYEFFGKFFRGGGERFQPIDREIDSGDRPRAPRP